MLLEYSRVQLKERIVVVKGTNLTLAPFAEPSSVEKDTVTGTTLCPVFTTVKTTAVCPSVTLYTAGTNSNDTTEKMKEITASHPIALDCNAISHTVIICNSRI